MRTTKRVIKPRPIRVSKYAKYNHDVLDEMSTEELYALGAELKDNLKEETLSVAIVTVLGRRGIQNPTF